MTALTPSVNLPGWYLQGWGTFPGVNMIVSDGSTDCIHGSYGATASTDRALCGGRSSFGINSTIGTLIQNNSINAITSITITYTGEQWRRGSLSFLSVLDFEYRLFSSSPTISGGGYIANNALDFVSPHTSGLGSPIDGNQAANRTLKTATISGINWAPGTWLAVRWTNTSAAASPPETNHVIGIDDFSLSGSYSTLTTSAITTPIICPDNATTVQVPYTKTGSFVPGNVFTAQLSDATGSFASPTNIGSVTSTAAGTISCTIPTSIAEGTGYRIRIISSLPSLVATDNGTDLVINCTKFISTGGHDICQTNSVLYGVSALAAATGYNWSVSPATAATLAPDGVSCVATWSSTFNGIATLTATPVNPTYGNATPATKTVMVNPLHGVNLNQFTYERTSSGKHYYRSNNPTTWANAKVICETSGCGNLMAVSSSTENLQLNYMLETTVKWIGGTDEITDGSWKWVNGEPDFNTYSNWYTGEPNGGINENYTEAYPENIYNLKWNDATGANSREFLMERANNEAISATFPTGTFCGGSYISVPVTVTGNFDYGIATDNKFELQLSNSAGNFSVFSIPVYTVLQSVVGTSSFSFNTTLPVNANGTNYKLRVRSTSPRITSNISSGITINPGVINGTIATGPPSVSTSTHCQCNTYVRFNAHNFTNVATYNWSLAPATAGTISASDSVCYVYWDPSFTGNAIISVTASNATSTCSQTRNYGYTISSSVNHSVDMSLYTYAGLFNGSHYYYSINNNSWLVAKLRSEDNCGTLVGISSAPEQTFVSQIGTGNRWIGGTVEMNEGTSNYQWVNGEPWGYTNWGAGQPDNSGGNEDYLHMSSPPTWNDRPDNQLFRYIMERTADQTISVSNATPTQMCKGSSYDITFTKTGAFNTGNVFTVQLSDATGSFSSPTNLTPTYTGTGSTTIANVLIPTNTPQGTGYRIRVVSSNPEAPIVNDNGSDIAIYNVPTGSITSTGGANICGGQTVLYGVTATDNSPSAIWEISPSNFGTVNGTGASTYVTWDANQSGTAILTANLTNGSCIVPVTRSITLNGPHGADLSLFTWKKTYNGKHYYSSNATSAWSTAKINSEESCGNLVAITDVAESTALTNMSNGIFWSTTFWIGGTDEITEGTFQWVNGETFSYTNYLSGQPDNGSGLEHYLRYYRNPFGTSGWADHQISVSNRSIMERPANETLALEGVIPAQLCLLRPHTISYTATGIFDIGNTFSLQLSDASGVFNATPTVLATTTAYSPGTFDFNFTMPVVIEATGYRIRVVSSSPGITSSDNGFDIEVLTCPDYSITTTGNQIIITDLSGNGETLTMSNDAGALNFAVAGRAYTLDGAPGALFPVSIPLTGVTDVIVNTAVGNDIIDIGAFTNFPSLTINGGVGDDAVNFTGSLTFATNANLDLNMQNDDPTPGVDNVVINSSISVALSGTGAAVIKASKNLFMDVSSSLSVRNGDLTIECNQQPTPTGGTFNAVHLYRNRVQIESTGTGVITIKGIGGNGGGDGVVVDGACSIKGGTTGTTTIDGIGGAAYGRGVMNNGSISTIGSNLQATGFGGGAGTNSNNNFGIYNAGSISASGSGAITINGTGGTSSGNGNVGILNGVNYYITSSGGNVSLSGFGGGSGASSYNIGIEEHGLVRAGSGGTVSVQGTGGATSGGNNHGVYAGQYANITSIDGAVSVTGQAGGTGTSFSDHGVYVVAAGKIRAGSNGAVTVSGTGGVGSGDANYGVYVTDAGSTITSAGGNVSVTGQGGGSAASADNHGVFVDAAGQITAGSTGAISVNGTGGLGTGNTNCGVYVNAASSTITSAGGNVSVTGQGGGNAASADNHGVLVDLAGTIRAGGTGTLVVNGTGGLADGDDNVGIHVNETGSSISSSDGNITLTGLGGGTSSSSYNYGVLLDNDGLISAGGNGNLTINGTAGTSTGSANTGVYVQQSGSTISTAGGQLSVTGMAGANASSGYGVRIFGGLLTTPASGNITVHGTSDDVSFGNAVQVYGLGKIKSVDGNIHITGVNPQSTSAFSLSQFIGGSPTLECTGTGSITVVANTMGISTSSVIRTTASGSVTFRPETNGNSILLGGADVANTTLGLTDAELDRILTPTPIITIGDANSGGHTISAAITRSYLTNINLFSGTGIHPDYTVVDVNTAIGTLKFGTGSTLNIDIDGLAANTDYKQLAVNGLVNLNSAILQFVGSSHIPSNSESFIIVDNDGTDPITGTFAGLAEGATISNFLGSALNATISYVGGTGNDVEITVEACTQTTWYLDADNDGYYVSSTSACASPGAGYNQTATTSGDCDDNDNTKWQNINGYVDADGDGYTVGTIVSVCSGSTLPTGYVTTSLGTDCDDSNAAVHPNASELCNGIDDNCNGIIDENGAIDGTTYYRDLDGDGYGDASTTVISCSQPPSYVLDNTDCNDADNTIWQSALLYIDADADGYDDGSATICYGATVPTGYAASTLGSDCDDTDNTLWQNLNGYTDADGDGYTVGSIQSICSGATLPSGYVASSLGSDCNDANSGINPDATEICGNSVDEDCSGSDLACAGNTWTGLVNTDWNNSGNWSIGVPTASTDGIIPTTPIGGVFPVVNISNAEAADLELQSGATLTIPSGNTITVFGVLTNNGNMYVNDSGSLVQTTGSTLAGSGTYNVVRNGRTGSQYNFWSSPITAHPNVPGNPSYAYNPANVTQWTGDDAHDPGWGLGYNGPMTPGVGYAGRGGGATTFSGTVNNGSIDVTIVHPTPYVDPVVAQETDPDGTPFNLVGNPYPSAINAAQLVIDNTNDIEGTIYFWNDDNSAGSDYDRFDFAYWNHTGGLIGSGNPSSGGGPSMSPSGYIASAQGFYVQVKPGHDGTLNFNNAQREAGNNGQFLRVSGNNSRLWLRLQNDSLFNQILIGVLEDATTDEDPLYDAVKMRDNTSISMSAVANNLRHSIMAFPPPAVNSTIPLRVEVAEEGTYSFVPHVMEGFDAFDVYLTDVELNTDVILEEETSIAVQLTEGLYENRFFLNLIRKSFTGVEDIDDETLMVYASNGLLHIGCTGCESDATIQLIDMSGRVVLEEQNPQFNGENTTILINAFSTGVYVVRITTQNQVLSQKIINR